MVGSSGLEPPTSRLSGARSSLLSYEPLSFVPALPLGFTIGGDEEIRTLDPLLAGQVLSQLSYTPISISTYSVPSWTLKIEQRKTVELNSFLSLRYCEFTVFLLFRFAPLLRSVFSLRQHEFLHASLSP